MSAPPISEPPHAHRSAVPSGYRALDFHELDSGVTPDEVRRIPCKCGRVAFYVPLVEDDPNEPHEPTTEDPS